MLAIFKTFRWMLSVLSNALSNLFVLYVLFALFFLSQALITHLAYGHVDRELSQLQGYLFNQFSQFLGTWDTILFDNVNRVVLYLYVLVSMIFYFYFFWPIQITLVIQSLEHTVCKQGYPEEMESLTIREIFSTIWMFNIKPWSILEKCREMKKLPD